MTERFIQAAQIWYQIKKLSVRPFYRPDISPPSLLLPGRLRSMLGHSECRHLTQLIRPVVVMELSPGAAHKACVLFSARQSHMVELGDSGMASPLFFHSSWSFQHPLRARDGKIITLWLLTFPCMISHWYNSITLSNKPFQKQLEPDFNWAASQLLFALIWLSHCWIAFDDRVRRSRWDNHSPYPALIPVLSNTRDIAVQVRETVTPNQAKPPKHPPGGWERLGMDWFCPSFHLVPPSQGLQFIRMWTTAFPLCFGLPETGKTCPLFVIHLCCGCRCPPGWRRRIGGQLLSPGSDPRCQGRQGQR